MFTWKNVELILMHIVAVAAILFAFWIAVTPVKAQPSNNHCHKHGAVVHCH